MFISTWTIIIHLFLVFLFDEYVFFVKWALRCSWRYGYVCTYYLVCCNVVGCVCVCGVEVNSTYGWWVCSHSRWSTVLFVRTCGFSFFEFLIFLWLRARKVVLSRVDLNLMMFWLIYHYLVPSWWVSYCLIRCFHVSSMETIVGCLCWMLVWCGVLWSLATHTFRTHCFFWFTEVFKTSVKFLWNKYLYCRGKPLSPYWSSFIIVRLREANWFF